MVAAVVVGVVGRLDRTKWIVEAAVPAVPAVVRSQEVQADYTAAPDYHNSVPGPDCSGAAAVIAIATAIDRGESVKTGISNSTVDS
jgi:hypothetical protein